MWKKQNEYNHPRKAMQRMQEAGLNPNLIYGKGSAGLGTAGDIPAGQAPEINAGLSEIPDTIDRYQRVRMSEAQINQVNEVTKGQELLNINQEIKNILDNDALDWDKKKRRMEALEKRWSAKLLGMKAILNDPSVNGSIVAHYEAQVAKLKSEKKGQDLQNELLELERQFWHYIQGAKLLKSIPGLGKFVPFKKKK